MAESFGYVGQSLVLAVVLMYAILASQFRSFLQPLAIMLSLPLAFDCFVCGQAAQWQQRSASSPAVKIPAQPGPRPGAEIFAF